MNPAALAMQGFVVVVVAVVLSGCGVFAELPPHDQRFLVVNRRAELVDVTLMDPTRGDEVWEVGNGGRHGRVKGTGVPLGQCHPTIVDVVVHDKQGNEVTRLGRPPCEGWEWILHHDGTEELIEHYDDEDRRRRLEEWEDRLRD